MKEIELYEWISRNLSKAVLPKENPKHDNPDIIIDGDFITSNMSFVDELEPVDHAVVVMIRPVDKYGYYIIKKK